MPNAKRAVALGAIVLAGCGPSDDSPAIHASGARGQLVVHAADEAGVPAAIVLAMAHIEGGLTLADMRPPDAGELVPAAGALEIRHGAFDSLRRGAALLGTDEGALVADFALATRAGARVLAEIGAETGARTADLASWADAIERMSGFADEPRREEYRSRVFAALRAGFSARALGGETIGRDADDAIPIALTLSPPLLGALGTPDYAGAFWISTPMFASTSCGSTSQKYQNYRNADVSMIAIHDTEAGWDASVSTLQNEPCKSVHYIVDADGSRIGQFVPETYTAWHVGNSYYNARMIGIEHVGSAYADDYQTPMYEASAGLVEDITSRYGLAIDRSTLIAHQEVPDGINLPQDAPPCSDTPARCIASGEYGGANHHDDPGVYWEWCQYTDIMGGACKCTDATSIWTCTHDGSMRVRCVDDAVEIVHCADACIVEAAGVDDQCTELPGSSTSGSSGSTDPTADSGDVGVAHAGADAALKAANEGGTSSSACGLAAGAGSGTRPRWAGGEGLLVALLLALRMARRRTASRA